MSEKLRQVREYEASKSVEIPAEQRPAFHVSPLAGWANDPNGFSCFQGEYHLFYQYHPYSTRWGPMHWGHYKTKDFIRWEPLPCALAPETPYDERGCFSGSALEWNGKHYLMYTSVAHVIDENGREVPRQTQSIAVGDGVNYEKFPANPVITADKLPKGSSVIDFRDPKVWQDGDTFYVVIGNRSDDTSGQLTLFSSKDMENWSFVGILDRCNNEYGKMWECPDFFELEGKHVVITSPQEMLAQGLEFHAGNGSLCLIGDYDKTNHTFARESAQPVDYGMDYYASQTTGTPDGRRILIAWMNSWENYLTPRGFKWSGFMTLPRELHIKNGRLYQNPVRELENYHGPEHRFEVETASVFTELPKVSGRVFDMTIELNVDSCKDFELRLAANDRFYTSLSYDGVKGTFTTDRTYSGMTSDLLTSRAMEVSGQDGRLKLRVVMDKYSIEVFVNDGEKAMTSLIFTEPDAEKILFRSDGVFSVKFSQIRGL